MKSQLDMQQYAYLGHVVGNREVRPEQPKQQALQVSASTLLPIGTAYNITSIKIIKNEVGCRDDTVPKTVDTRRHCEEE